MGKDKIDAIDVALLLGAACLWASAFSSIKIAVSELGPISVGASRCLIASLVLLPFVFRKTVLDDVR